MTVEERKAEEFIEKNRKLWEEGELTIEEIVRLTYITVYKEVLKMKLNTTTISDAPLMEREQLEKAKKIILSLYNAGRDILMCGYTEETQKRLEDKINAKEIEQFLKEVENV
ncbi:MAG: hypothetical protein K6E97_03715 [Treponema sp.]|nr:hypothetical protein [Treponema sp.]